MFFCVSKKLAFIFWQGCQNMNRVAVGTITRRTASSVNGTTTTLTTATTILASAWSCAPRAHTNGVNRPWWKMYIRVHFSSTRFAMSANLASAWNQRHPCRYWKNNFAVHKIKQVNITYSERPWMGVVLSRNEFVKTNSQLTNVHGGTFVNDTDFQLRTNGCGNECVFTRS